MRIATSEEKEIIDLYKEGFGVKMLASYFRRPELYIKRVLKNYGYL